MDISLSILSSESELIQACIRKEEWAQQKIYEDNYRNLLVVCMRYAANQDDALDILHDGFFKIFTNIGSYEPNTSLTAWMRRIVVNTSIDYYRSKSRRQTADLDEAQHINHGSSSPIDALTLEEVMKAVQKLSLTYRSVFNLYIIEGYSHKEIADTLGVSENTSKSQYSRARAFLRNQLEKVERDWKR